MIIDRRYDQQLLDRLPKNYEALALWKNVLEIPHNPEAILSNYLSHLEFSHDFFILLQYQFPSSIIPLTFFRLQREIRP